MQDPLDRLQDSQLSYLGVLDRVDEYTLYCHYLGFQPLLNTAYRSFVRVKEGKADDNPSFSIFNSFKPTREYMWKDAGLGESGDIFKLIRILFGYSTMREALERVNHDFKLGFEDHATLKEKITHYKKPDNPPETDIRIHSRPFNKKDLEYWAGFGITPEILKQYKVKALKYYWLFKFQVDPNVAAELAYSYEVLKKYKIYQPKALKKYKFRNNFSVKCLEGFAQLTYHSDLLIITKALKDVMTLRALGYDAVAPRGENILIPNEYLSYFKTRYKRIVILFDNDMKHKGDEYPYPKIYVPLTSRTKDISDFRKAYGEQETRKLLEELIHSPLQNVA